jgi:hypothetical protein
MRPDKEFAQLADALVSQSRQLAEFEQRLVEGQQIEAEAITAAELIVGFNRRIEAIETSLKEMERKIGRLEEFVKLPVPWPEVLERIRASKLEYGLKEEH